ncbi:MAG: Trk system potassium transporter TrkA, partial [Thermoplasmata archaeon]
MYAIIGGAGEVGYYVAKSLYSEGYNIAIIEKDPTAADHAETLDALVIRGNAASPRILEEAGIKNADIYIGVTSSDETNMIGCAIANSYGCKTIARINNTDYVDDPVTTEKYRGIGIHVAICPDLVAATKMARIITMPALLDTDIFAKGKIQILETKIEENSEAAGKMVQSIPIPSQCNLVAIFRDQETIIPQGNTKLMPNDCVVTAIGDPSCLHKVESLFGTSRSLTMSEGDIKKVMIVGATRIGIRLAKILERQADVVLIEPDEGKCKIAAEQVAGSIIIHGSPTDKEVLKDEGILNVDAFLAATDKEGVNVLACLLAKQLGAKKTIALVDQPELKTTLMDIGVDIAISPRLATVNSILQYAHQSKSLLSLSVLQNGEARVLELQ